MSRRWSRVASLTATTDMDRLADVDVMDICVPTPLGKTRDPDISFIQSAVDAIAPRMHDGVLVILESTTYPGTTEEVIVPRLAEGGLSSAATSSSRSRPSASIPAIRRTRPAISPRSSAG